MSRGFYFISVLVIIAVIFDPTNTSGAGRDRDVTEDYIWGTHRLRTTTLTCDQTVMQAVCNDICGPNYLCNDNKCLCIKENTNNRHKNPLRTLDENQFNDNQYMYSKEFDMDRELRTAIEGDTEAKDINLVDGKPKNTKLIYAKSEDTYLDAKPKITKRTDSDEDAIDLVESLEEDRVAEHPALRHHIAHFCQNLKEARACIRRCMKLGKPAFCGKDHVCYCGHQYTSHDKNGKINPEDVYAVYRDIYQKYFGPRIFEQEASEE